MTNPWIIADREWAKLSDLFVGEQPMKLRFGRPAREVDRNLVELCLSRYFLQYGKTSTFKWRQAAVELELKEKDAVAANRHLKEWLANGTWVRFWDSLMTLRAKRIEYPRADDTLPDSRPVQPIVAELHRAYTFFNERFFGGHLEQDVAIALERPSKNAIGMYCGRQWQHQEAPRNLPYIVVSTACLGKGVEVPMETLLHEIVHLRNDQYGLQDCKQSRQYHNLLFRDVAHLAGLDCAERDNNVGFALTSLNERARAAIEELNPDAAVFRWEVGAGPRSSQVRP